jgi:hypothetical protein
MFDVFLSGLEILRPLRMAINQDNLSNRTLSWGKLGSYVLGETQKGDEPKIQKIGEIYYRFPRRFRGIDGESVTNLEATGPEGLFHY